MKKERSKLLRAEQTAHGTPQFFLEKEFSGSMTLEAALVLPLFLFFFMNILFVFDMIRLQSGMTAALQQAGQQITEYGYYYRYGLSDLLEQSGGESDGEIVGGSGTGETVPEKEQGDVPGELGGAGLSFLLSETFVRGQVRSFLGEEYLDHTCLSGGTDAISYLRSDIMEGNDTVALVADYRVRPFIRILGLEDFAVQSRYYAHAWVGYGLGNGDGGSQGKEETYCYLTETGTVYHRARDCTYLNPSIRSAEAGEVDGLRNNGGGKYYPCESCRPVKAGTLFITAEGNRYHNSTGCSGLKRTVREVPLSQVEGKMPCCSKCGGT